jgi:hypothetical protein
MSIFKRGRDRNAGGGRAGISRQFMGQAERDRMRGTEAEDVAGERLRDFDAEEGAARAGRAQYETFEKDLGRNIESLRGSQVGRGRINSGFGFEDEDRLVEGSLEDLNRQLAQNALQAQGLNLSATGQLAGLGGQQTNRYLEVLGSERDASFLEEEMERRKKADKRSGLFSALGTIAKGAGGFLAGGPGGAAAALAT